MMLYSDNGEENRLAALLSDIKKPTLPPSRQEILKSRISRQISREAPRALSREVTRGIWGAAATGERSWQKVLVRKLTEVASSIALPFRRRVLLREKLFAVLPPQSRRGYPFFSSFRFFRAAASITLAFFLVFVFSNVFVDAPVAKAAATTLTDFHGHVEVIRDGKSAPAVKNFQLKSKDIVKTHKNSKATIRFMDDSVSRLSADTVLLIQKLSVDVLNPTKTEVELQLINGMLWARVFSLIDEFSTFQVNTDKAVLTAKKKAAFNVAVEKERTKVKAVSNAVDIKVANKQELVSTTLVKGYELQADAKGAVVEVSGGEEESWIRENVEKDKNHLLALKEEYSAERLQKTEERPFVGVLILNGFEKEKAKILEAEAKLREAEKLMDANRESEAEVLLKEFVALAREVAIKARALEPQDKEKSRRLFEVLNDTLKNYKKQFDILLPDDVFYELKEAIFRVEVAIAETPAEAVKKRFEKASEKLAEIQSLAEKGNIEYAISQLLEFKAIFMGALADMDVLDDKGKADVASAVLAQNSYQLKLLEALSESLPESLPDELLLDLKKNLLIETGAVIVESPLPEVFEKTGEPVEPDANLAPLAEDAEINEGKIIIEKSAVDKTVIMIEARPSAKDDSLPDSLPETDGSGSTDAAFIQEGLKTQESPPKQP